ncbi:MAG: hypothetical protein WCW16_03090 [Candidatus Magasanikbacteria bacterium]
MFDSKKNLNQWQAHNVSVLTPEMIEQVKAGNWAQAGTSLLRCVKCGQYRISGPIAKWFDMDGKRMLCFPCQRALSQTHSPMSIKEVMSGSANASNSAIHLDNEFRYPSDTEIQNEMNEVEWREQDIDWRSKFGITTRQALFLKSLICDRIQEEETREAMLASLPELSREDASEQITQLLATERLCSA